MSSPHTQALCGLGERFGARELAPATLLAIGALMLEHSIGKSNRHDTVLTVDEFCSRLDQIREELRPRSWSIQRERLALKGVRGAVYRRD